MEAKAKETVIVNRSLESRRICKHFQQKGLFRVRVSDSTQCDTCIFPKSSIAFLLLDESELQQEETFNRIQKFTQIHGNGHTLCIENSRTLDDRLFGLFSTILLRLPPSSKTCCFNVVNSYEEATDTMINVAKLHSGLVGQSLVQEADKMQESLVAEDTIKTVLSSLPLTSQESTIVLDRCGSVGRLACAPEELLLDGGLDRRTARNLQNFFRTDTYHI